MPYADPADRIAQQKRYSESLKKDPIKLLERRAKSREYSTSWRKRNPEKAKEIWSRFDAKPETREAKRDRDKKRKRDPEKIRAHNVSYRKNNWGKIKAYKRSLWASLSVIQRQAIARRRRYKITQEQFEELWQQQNGICPLCERALEGLKVHLDHCHHTGTIRGILCAGCNLGLGKFGDSVEQLQRAVSYLKKFQCDGKLTGG